MQYTNELIHESSPYLLQHAHNPVNWYPWGEKAFEKARKENKMMLISIGYAACHWCHVMEHESFENEDVAAIMNEHFVNIKVDREERPDVDMIYMNAAQLIHGNGGWPLNALALPNGKPFFAATYFPPDRWMQLLKYFIQEYKNNLKELTVQAENLSTGIARIDEMPPGMDEHIFELSDARKIKEKILSGTDPEYGGLRSRVKFPMPSVWEWLLKYHYLTGDADALQSVLFTLDNMKDGGIYDQIGGGFARYATDREWHIPHFEKMLYDNVQLISLYSHAFQVTRKEEYADTVRETISFIQRELSDGKGFYSSLDADSEKEEGKFYVWSYDEIHRTLKEDAGLFCSRYGITESGNWEDGKNIPDKNLGDGRDDELIKIRGCKRKLFEARSQRIRPSLDDKIITAWNAMACSALMAAGKALGQKEYIETAGHHLDFLISQLWDAETGVLYRNYKKDKRSVPGFLDDYAFLIKALIDYYQISFEKKYLDLAFRMIELTLEHFHNASNQLFFYNDARFNELISRPSELSDGVIPSSTAVMAGNLWVSGTLFDKPGLADRATAMLQSMKTEITSNPAYQSYWAAVMLYLIHPPFEVAIIGKEWPSKLHELSGKYLPLTIFCGSEMEENLPLLKGRYKDNHTTIYVCQNKTCRQPVNEVGEAIQQMKSPVIKPSL